MHCQVISISNLVTTLNRLTITVQLQSGENFTLGNVQKMEADLPYVDICFSERSRDEL
jgi:hypothetical protein